jgi:hypothetical protein
MVSACPGVLGGVLQVGPPVCDTSQLHIEVAPEIITWTPLVLSPATDAALSWAPLGCPTSCQELPLPC